VIATDIGVEGDTIKIGLLADLTGPFGILVQDIVDAEIAYWEQANAAGGVAGQYQVDLVVRDTAYDIPNHQTEYAALKEEVAAFAQSTGSPHTSSIVPDLKADNMFVIPLSWYSGWADPDFGGNILEQGANYCIEGMNLVEFAVEKNQELGGTDKPKVAIISRAGEYGEDGATGFKLGAEAMGLEVVYDGQGKIIADADLTALITAEVAPTAPDWVFVTSTSGELGALIGAAAASGFEAQWTGSAPSYNQRLLDSAIGEYLAGHYYPSWYLVPWSSDAPENVKMKDALGAEFPDRVPTDWFVRGWAEGLMMHQVLEAAVATGDLTQKGILDAALALESIDFKGIQPAQGYAGEPNDFLLRESIVFSIDYDAYIAGGGGAGTIAGDSSTGSVIEKDFFASAAAAAYDYQGPCFTPGS
jgi:ABC-type branched-subunit amino acid transport system substrate-binding protein